MSTQKRFRIGQVLFAFFAKEYQIVPFRIAEESVVRTLQGESISYKAVYGAASKLVEMSAFDSATIFENLSDAHAAMIAQAKGTIDRLVADAGAKAKAWFPSAVTAPVEVTQPQQVQTIDFGETAPDRDADGSPVVQLPDGTVARIKIGGQQPT